MRPPEKSVRRIGLPAVCMALLVALACAAKQWPTPGMQGYAERARPELRLTVDEMTPRKAAMVRMGLLRMSPSFVPAEELAISSPAAEGLFGQSHIAPPSHLLKEEAPPSTEFLEGQDRISSALTEVSIVCRGEDLFHDETGIVTNALKSGREWERPAWMSARQDSRLVVESPIGLRVHGGLSRNSPQQSFRMIFRETHGGHKTAPAGLFFGEDAPASTTFVLSNASDSSRFNSALAMEVAAMAGCITSRCTPVVVYLNGTRVRTPYFLYQHQSEEFAEGRTGIPVNQMDWVRLKSKLPTENAEYIKWRRWIRRARFPISMEEEAARFNLEDLSSWALAMTFTATTDNNQGGYFKDRRNPNSPWRTTVWDMDQAFNESVHFRNDRQFNFRDEPFEALIGDRGKLFFRLIEGSAEYREYFLKFVQEKLRTTMTREKLLAAADRHLDVARVQPDRAPTILEVLTTSRDFLGNRHEPYLRCVEKRLREAEVTHRTRARAIAGN